MVVVVEVASTAAAARARARARIKSDKTVDFPSIPTSKLPSGWMMMIVPQKNREGKGPKSDQYYFSPEQKIRFCSICEVEQFLKQIKEVGDDKTKAQVFEEVELRGGEKRMTGKIINNTDDSDDDDHHDNNVDFDNVIICDNNNDDEQS